MLQLGKFGVFFCFKPQINGWQLKRMDEKGRAERFITSSIIETIVITKLVCQWCTSIHFIYMRCLWTGPQEVLQNFLRFINSPYRCKKDVLEVNAQQFDCFNLSISFHTGKNSFKVFCKPTTTHILIHGSSKSQHILPTSLPMKWVQFLFFSFKLSRARN